MKTAAGEAAIRNTVPVPEPAVVPALLRIPMSAMVAGSSLAGFLASPIPPSVSQAILLTTAIFLLAAGCSALNQLQERAEDALMERTRRRPLPTGRIAPGPTLAAAGTLIACALFLLSRLEHPAAGWGILALLLYNGIYTGLKKRTSFALLAGALCGALPPLMGWYAAGGDPTDHRIVGLTVLFLLWQIPHTWMISERHPSDSTAGPFASLFKRLNAARMARLKRIWLLALGSASLHLPAFGTLRAPLAQSLCIALCGGLLLFAVRTTETGPAKLHSKILTLYMGALICLVILDNLTF